MKGFSLANVCAIVFLALPAEADRTSLSKERRDDDLQHLRYRVVLHSTRQLDEPIQGEHEMNAVTTSGHSGRSLRRSDKKSSKKGSESRSSSESSSSSLSSSSDNSGDDTSGSESIKESSKKSSKKSSKTGSKKRSKKGSKKSSRKGSKKSIKKSSKKSSKKGSWKNSKKSWKKGSKNLSRSSTSLSQSESSSNDTVLSTSSPSTWSLDSNTSDIGPTSADDDDVEMDTIQGNETLATEIIQEPQMDNDSEGNEMDVEEGKKAALAKFIPSVSRGDENDN